MKKLLKIIIFCVACFTLAISSADPHERPHSVAKGSPILVLSALRSIPSAIKNRIFIGQLAGSVMLLTQHWPNQKNYCTDVLDACDNDRFKLVDMMYRDFEVRLIICYPKGWNKNDRSKCAVFYLPNNALVSNYIYKTSPIGDNNILAELLNYGPVVLFDYPNTGINYDVNEYGGVTYHCPFFKNTTESQILEYSEAVLDYAAKNFDSITVAGISLGGAIATITLERYLQQNTYIDYNRFRLVNIDSFTSIPRVVMPSMLKLADILGWLSGVKMDAQTSMAYLINHNINILVFNHIYDQVIPLQARMAQYTMDFKRKQNVTSINSTEGYSHCSLDEYLKKQLAIFFKKN